MYGDDPIVGELKRQQRSDIVEIRGDFDDDVIRRGELLQAGEALRSRQRTPHEDRGSGG